ncbi:MAG TPA: hypothetical protein VNT01_17845 [Symbiobacteriaceae bacterium]|nr:hypothetical protein [Symbiobacteriaceae bacterium]
MKDIRCQCGKIVCQVQNIAATPRVETSQQPAPGPAAIIMCRHCKRYVVLRFPTIASVACVADVRELA